MGDAHRASDFWVCPSVEAWLRNDGHSPEIDPHTAQRRARAATLLMLALPGSAYLYQGEELGLLEVTDLTSDQIRDPVYERTEHQVKGRDGARVPLPWTSAAPTYGFSNTTAWLPQPPWFAQYAAARQLRDPTSTLQLYRSALRLRHELLTDDDTVRWINTPDAPDVLHLVRSNGWHCLVNFSTQPVALPNGTPLLSSEPNQSGQIAPDTAHWFREV